MRRAFVDELADALAHLGPDEAHDELVAALDELTPLELAALNADWDGTWARESQIIPVAIWRSLGFLTGRRFGKTRSIAEFVNREAMAGRAMRIGFCAQNEDKAIEVQVEGECGLIATSPPWFKAAFESGRVVWPNGAQAFVFTPEKPGNIRGPGVHLFWASEIQSWPARHRQEAWDNASLMTSLGYAKTVWDATPKRRHPILKLLLARESNLHVVVRGSIRENEENLGRGVVEDLARAIGGTRTGSEELDGVFFDEQDGALWKQEWIDLYRRDLPAQLKRKIIAIDPGRSMREGTDPTGMVAGGLDFDGQALILEDFSERVPPAVWAPRAIDKYMSHRCDLLVAERDSGGNMVAEVIRLQAEKREIRVVTIDDRKVPRPSTRHDPRTIYVLEINTQQKGKAERAQPVADAYETGRVSHVEGADLAELEDELTTWEPDAGMPSPNRLDAAVHVVRELLNLQDRTRDRSADMKGIDLAARKLAAAQSSGTKMPIDRAQRPRSRLVIRGGGGGL